MRRSEGARAPILTVGVPRNAFADAAVQNGRLSVLTNDLEIIGHLSPNGIFRTDGTVRDAWQSLFFKGLRWQRWPCSGPHTLGPGRFPN